MDGNALLEQFDLADSQPPAPRPAILKVNYSHKAMADMILTEPAISQNELGRRFGYSPSWISTVLATDAFQAMLSERQEQIVDPVLRIKVKDQLEGLMLRSMEILREKLNAPSNCVPDQLVLRSLELSSRAAGYGARSETKVEVNVSTHIEQHGEQLLNLLRRKKAELAPPIQGEVISSDKV